MADIIAIFDIIGAGCFLLAAFVAGSNYARTKDLSLVWAIFTAALFISFIWAAMVSAQWLGIYPEIMAQMQTPVLASSVTAYAIAAFMSLAKKYLFVS